MTSSSSASSSSANLGARTLSPGRRANGTASASASTTNMVNGFGYTGRRANDWSSEDSGEEGRVRGEGAIYTSPGRKRKGKEREAEVSGVQLHEGSLRARNAQQDEGTSSNARPKSCLKTTSSSSSAASLDESTEREARTNLGARLVRFTLGLGGRGPKRKERARPNDVFAGETETDGDEPVRAPPCEN